MLDQSFSYQNFRILLDVENRKGKYLEDKMFFSTDIFKISRKISKELIEKNKEIKTEIEIIKNIKAIEKRDYSTLDRLNDEKEKIKERRELALQTILQEIASKTDAENFELKLQRGKIKWGDQLYETEHTPENYFVNKQLQRNIFKTFKVKQANRKDIISQVRLILDDGFPKVIIRTDIKKFYESIPHNRLISLIEENSLLNYPSKKIIKSSLNQYWKILLEDGVKDPNDDRTGIPRGIGFSAYLSELYLRAFDKKVKSLSGVTYYTRYVDDILLVITPRHRNEVSNKLFYINTIKKILQETSQLRLNENKTEVINLTKESKERKVSRDYTLTYLGYKFIIPYRRNARENNQRSKGKYHISKGKLEIKMSDDKLNRMKKKLDNSFDDYNSKITKYPTAKNATQRMLLKRTKFLTNNHRLLRRKSNVFIGIFFSNQFLTKPVKDLKELDIYLKNKILNLPASTNISLIEKLNRFSFEEGFISKKIIRVNTESFENGEMMKIWKSL